MRPVGIIRWAAASAVVAVAAVLAGCGDSTSEPVGIVRTSACAVSAPAGFTDAGVGAAVLRQVRDAAGQGVVDTTSSQRVSTAAQTQAALERYAADGCTLTVLVGPGGARALAQVASANPERAFLAVGTGVSSDQPDNVLSVDFDLRGSAYLAGFAAASATRTGTVAVSVSAGQSAGEDLLDSFDDGVSARAEQLGEEVTVVEAGTTAARTIDDTGAAGTEWATSVIAADADVLVPFGSASPQGVADYIGSLAEEAAHDDGAPEDDGVEGDGSENDGPDNDGAEGGGLADDGLGDGGPDDGSSEGAGPADDGRGGAESAGEPAGDVQPAGDAEPAEGPEGPEGPDGPEGAAGEEPGDTSAAEAELPVLIWYGSDGSKTLPRSVRNQVIASIIPDVGLGMRAVLTGWPGDEGNPESLVGAGSEDVAGGEELRDSVPELVGGLEVRARNAVGTLDNGGVEVVASDGMLGSITGLGRTISEGKALLDEQRAEEERPAEDDE